MTKTKLKVDLIKSGNENESLCKAVTSHNEGKIILALNDFISYANMAKAIRPYSCEKLLIYRSDDDNSLLFVSDDDGDSVCMTIQEIEVEELETVSDIPQGLFQQPGEVGYLGDN